MEGEDIFDQILGKLSVSRRDHSRAVGAKAAQAQELVSSDLRTDLVAAAVLHDIGYAHEELGVHPLDGARYLATLGFSTVACHLVAHHSASTYEAGARGGVAVARS